MGSGGGRWAGGRRDGWVARREGGVSVWRRKEGGTYVPRGGGGSQMGHGDDGSVSMRVRGCGGGAAWLWSARGPHHWCDAVTCPCRRRGGRKGQRWAVAARRWRWRRRQVGGGGGMYRVAATCCCDWGHVSRGWGCMDRSPGCVHRGRRQAHAPSSWSAGRCHCCDTCDVLLAAPLAARAWPAAVTVFVSMRPKVPQGDPKRP